MRDRLTGILGRRLSIVGGDPRPGWDLFTGMYEVSLQHGYKSHGKYAYDCTLYRALPIGLRDAATAVLSFVGMEDVAHRWRSCTGDASAPATPPPWPGSRHRRGSWFSHPPGSPWTTSGWLRSRGPTARWTTRL